MSRRFAARPSSAESWVKASPAPFETRYTARLTIDVTPQLRARIKVYAFERDLTVADLLRSLLEREFGSSDGGQ